MISSVKGATHEGPMNYKGATILPTGSQSRIVILGKIEAREFENQAAAEARRSVPRPTTTATRTD